tara:strand:- start:1460 stop:1708 length:249 start_codon:yes stop_codon:yes gene_type:complete
MKIRFYQNIDGYRWVGFFIALISVFILSSANTNTQWLGWCLSVIGCSLWVYIGYKDKDIARTLMELMYLALSLRAVINWINA